MINTLTIPVPRASEPRALPRMVPFSALTLTGTTPTTDSGTCPSRFIPMVTLTCKVIIYRLSIQTIP